MHAIVPKTPSPGTLHLSSPFSRRARVDSAVSAVRSRTAAPFRISGHISGSIAESIRQLIGRQLCDRWHLDTYAAFVRPSTVSEKYRATMFVAVDIDDDFRFARCQLDVFGEDHEIRSDLRKTDDAIADDKRQDNVR
jgi:hypothetical protein